MKWKDFRLQEESTDHEGKMSKNQLERSMGNKNDL